MDHLPFFRRGRKKRNSPEIEREPEVEAPHETAYPGGFTEATEYTPPSPGDQTSYPEDYPSTEEAIPVVKPIRGYKTSREHLDDELQRIDLMARSQTVRWRMSVADHKPETMWGMLHVSDAEVDAYLDLTFLPPGQITQGMLKALQSFWHAAANHEHIIQQRLDATPRSTELRLERLQEYFDLSDLQRDILLVCLLPELDGRYRRLFGYLQDDASRSQPTVELAGQILLPVQPSTGEDMHTALDGDGALLAQGMIVLGGEARGDDALNMRSLRLDDRIAAYLLGKDQPDSRLASILEAVDPLDWSELPFTEIQIARLNALADSLHLLARQYIPLGFISEEGGAYRTGDAPEVGDDGGAGAPVFFLHGSYGVGRLKTARALCTAAGLKLLSASAPAALNSPLGWERAVALCYREAQLQRAALFWSGCETLLERSPDRPAEQWGWKWEQLIQAAESSPILSLFAASAPWDPANRFRERLFLSIELPPPSFAQRVRMWMKWLPPTYFFTQPYPDRALLARELANDFQFTEGQILDALATAKAEAALRSPSLPRLTQHDLYEGCRRQSSRSLVTYARRIEPRAELTFQDIILPLPNKRQLEELADRIQYRSQVYSDLGLERRLSLGKGLVVLFTGASGTGKTMAAELLARTRGVDLYKVDLSAVTSKWVGETEKNLSRMFSEAEEANAIIFFDEADALFGKRGEVKEAQDRWANMEVNFLLQRIEEYAGVVIMASNLRQNIDEAFLRRIQWIVDFPFPDPEARLGILRRMFPTTVQRPTDQALGVIAERFRLTGGSLKNVVVDATFRSLVGYQPASGKMPRIYLRHLVLAAAREYQKMGLPITRGEFGNGYFNYVESKLLIASL